MLSPFASLRAGSSLDVILSEAKNPSSSLGVNPAKHLCIFFITAGILRFAQTPRSAQNDSHSFPCHPALKSLHAGLAETIRATFFARTHPLICFSRWIAARISPKTSK